MMPCGRLGWIALVSWGLATCGVALAQSPNVTPAPGAAAAGSFPSWAYPWLPDFKAAADDGVPRHVPDSAAAFTLTQERDLFFAPDPIGIRPIIPRCPKSSRTAGGPR